MKERLFFLVFFIVTSIITEAQTDPALKKQTLHGIVKDEKNKPVQNASIHVKGDETTTLTDSLGLFKIDALPNSVLIINAEGYQSLTVSVKSKDIITATLLQTNKSGVANEPVMQKSVSNSLEDFGKAEGSKLYVGGTVTVFRPKEETKGSRYQFDQWAEGKILDTGLAPVNTGNFVFNYDKIDKKLLGTADRRNVIEINDNTIHSFILSGDSGTIRFVKVPVTGKKEFLVELVKSDKYSLYKSVKTTFQRANYTNNGIFDSGNKYDEFIDEFEYYVIFPGGKTFKKVELKKKSIRDVFSDEAKAKEYFSENGSAAMNELFLKNLVLFLNQ